jgi:hypothetical protein
MGLIQNKPPKKACSKIAPNRFWELLLPPLRPPHLPLPDMEDRLLVGILIANNMGMEKLNEIAVFPVEIPLPKFKIPAEAAGKSCRACVKGCEKDESSHPPSTSATWFKVS